MKSKIGKGIDFFPKEKPVNEDKHCPFFGEISVRGKIFEGIVTSDKMNRTVKVTWERSVRDRKYNRYLKKRSSVLAHNSEAIGAKMGDRVIIGETRPISKRKHFVVLKIVKKGENEK
jgi:small subunit ribosomal protein S17